MTDLQWNAFLDFKTQFNNYCNNLKKYSFLLTQIQLELANNKLDYKIENPICYNSDLDKITKDSNIKLIIVADNPGKNEQLSINKKYLIGLAGKLCKNFFASHKELNIDYETEVIVLNKTPVHSAKTKQLQGIDKALKNFYAPLNNLILDSQLFMAKITCDLFKALSGNENFDGQSQSKENATSLESPHNREHLQNQEQPPFKSQNLPSDEPKLFLVGYSELKNNGIFVPYKNELKQLLINTNCYNNLFVFQHFSMNRFSIDLKNYCSQNPNRSFTENLYALGTLHKNEIF